MKTWNYVGTILIMMIYVIYPSTYRVLTYKFSLCNSRYGAYIQLYCFKVGYYMAKYQYQNQVYDAFNASSFVLMKCNSKF